MNQAQRLTAGDLCTRNVAVALRSDMLDEAAREMRGRHVGCLVVVDETEAGKVVVGLLTDRDIVTTVVARDVAPATLRVADVMVADVVCVREDDSLADVLGTMQRRRVRRVPVVGAQNALRGIISADDLLHTLSEQLRTLAQELGEQVKVEQMVRP
jgi:CBS domain-containing protein